MCVSTRNLNNDDIGKKVCNQNKHICLARDKWLVCRTLVVKAIMLKTQGEKRYVLCVQFKAKSIVLCFIVVVL